MNFTHIKLKPTNKIKLNFNPSEVLKEVEIPKESKRLAREYIKSSKMSDDYEVDLVIHFQDNMIFGFDFLHNNKKLIIPEINPTTIFYSNAVMSHKRLVSFKQELFEKSPTINDYSNKPVNPNIFGNFFQLANNCIINLQSALESFANRHISDDYEFIDVKGDKYKPSVFHKLDSALPKIIKRRFKSKFKKDNILIRELIELRNDIVHIKPLGKDTNTQYNTQYKIVYRRLLNFDFTRAITSVRNLINFYEPNLIEECECGKEFFYDIYG